MPIIIKTIDQIMDDEKRDMYFIQFDTDPFDFASKRNKTSRRQHFEWFKARNLTHEIAAPRGWLEGDPGCHVVYFNGPDDPRVADYNAEFEDQTGKSLHPKKYQMVLLSYQWWLENDGPQHVSSSVDGDDWL